MQIYYLTFFKSEAGIGLANFSALDFIKTEINVGSQSFIRRLWEEAASKIIQVLVESIPCDHMTEPPVSSLAISCRLIFVPRGCLYSFWCFTYGPFPAISWVPLMLPVSPASFLKHLPLLLLAAYVITLYPDYPGSSPCVQSTE